MNNLGKKHIKFLLTNKTMIRNGDFITNRNLPDLRRIDFYPRIDF